MKELKFRVREDFDVEKMLHDNCKAHFLDAGASKEGWELDGLVYKIPLGYNELYGNDVFTKTIKYPYENIDFDAFINQVGVEHEELVWSIGQIVYEVMVWEHLKELEAQGYDISGFAAIVDYFLDTNGVPVIVQEYVHHSVDNARCFAMDITYIFQEENKDILNALADMYFPLEDFRRGNMEYDNSGKIKCFDFGISYNSRNIIDCYVPYEEWKENGYDTYCGDDLPF